MDHLHDWWTSSDMWSAECWVSSKDNMWQNIYKDIETQAIHHEGAHTPSVHLRSDIMSEETVLFSQGFTPAVDLCKMLYFSPINCAVSPANRTVSSVRTRSSSIPYRNEEKKSPFPLSLRDRQSSIHFSKRVAQCLQRAHSILLLFFFGPSLSNDNQLLKKKLRELRRNRGENCEAAHTFSSDNCTDFYSVLSSGKMYS